MSGKKRGRKKTISKMDMQELIESMVSYYGRWEPNTSWSYEDLALRDDMAAVRELKEFMQDTGLDHDPYLKMLVDEIRHDRLEQLAERYRFYDYANRLQVLAAEAEEAWERSLTSSSGLKYFCK